MDFNTLLAAFIGKLLYDVPLERSGIHYVEVRGGGFEHRKAIMMAGGYTEVFCSGILEGGHPFRRIEFRGVESRRQILVFVSVQLLRFESPFALP